MKHPAGVTTKQAAIGIVLIKLRPCLVEKIF